MGVAEIILGAVGFLAFGAMAFCALDRIDRIDRRLPPWVRRHKDDR